MKEMIEYGVPFAYEKYGRIPVIAPKGTSEDELRRLADEKLSAMSVADMDKYSEYLSDSEEIDDEGIITEDGVITVTDDGTVKYDSVEE